MHTNKYRLIKYLIIGILSVGFSSCLKHDLPPYPTYGSDYINNVYFEYRWIDSNNVSDGSPVVGIESLTVAQQIDTATNTITCQITVPPANGDFDTYQRSLVALDSIWCHMDISPAATIAPIGNAPQLSYQGNYSIPQQYKVTAANPDSSRVWTIHVTSLIK